MKRKQICILAALLILLAWLLWGNLTFAVREITVSAGGIPEGFSGFRIAQISDLHNTRFGKDNRHLLAALRQAAPDIIVITGDFVDSYHTDLAVSIAFAAEAAKIAPVYYVTGNHESRIGAYGELKKGLEAAGVTVLQNEKQRIVRNGAYITLAGVEDPSFKAGDSRAVMQSALENLTAEEDGYTVLLSHRPELFDLYGEAGLDLVLAGHAHGGQFRIPFVGGVIAPGQGIFPQYDSGLYRAGDTCMIVSRGLGNSILPLRVNNRPEIILVELMREGNGT